MMRLRLGLPLIVPILLFAGTVSAQEGDEAGEPLRFARFADIRLYKAVLITFSLTKRWMAARLRS